MRLTIHEALTKHNSKRKKKKLQKFMCEDVIIEVC